MHNGARHLRCFFPMQGFVGGFDLCTGADIGIFDEGFDVGIFVGGSDVGIAVEGFDDDIFVGIREGSCEGIIDVPEVSTSDDAHKSSIAQSA